MIKHEHILTHTVGFKQRDFQKDPRKTDRLQQSAVRLKNKIGPLQIISWDAE